MTNLELFKLAIREAVVMARAEGLTRSQIAHALASGIETEGHDREAGHGAEHESPTGEAGDAQGTSQ